MSARHMVSIICDRCGEETGPLGERSSEARAAAIATGWTHPAFAQDLCPDCPPERKHP